jgi:hypothetical protein
MIETPVAAEVSAKNGQEAKTASANFKVAENLDELSSQFGAEVVFSHAKRSIIIALQTTMRAAIEANKTPEEIQAIVDDWKPGLKKPAKSPLDKVRDEISRMSPEDKKRIMKELRDRAN